MGKKDVVVKIPILDKDFYSHLEFTHLTSIIEKFKWKKYNIKVIFGDNETIS